MLEKRCNEQGLSNGPRLVGRHAVITAFQAAAIFDPSPTMPTMSDGDGTYLPFSVFIDVNGKNRGKGLWSCHRSFKAALSFIMAKEKEYNDLLVGFAPSQMAREDYAYYHSRKQGRISKPPTPVKKQDPMSRLFDICVEKGLVDIS